MSRRILFLAVAKAQFAVKGPPNSIRLSGVIERGGNDDSVTLALHTKPVWCEVDKGFRRRPHVRPPVEPLFARRFFSAQLERTLKAHLTALVPRRFRTLRRRTSAVQVLTVHNKRLSLAPACLI
jgi:hypothetical protein